MKSEINMYNHQTILAAMRSIHPTDIVYTFYISTQHMHANFYRGFSIPENVKLSYDSEWCSSLWHRSIANIFSSDTTISKCQSSILYIFYIRTDIDTADMMSEQYWVSYIMLSDGRGFLKRINSWRYYVIFPINMFFGYHLIQRGSNSYIFCKQVVLLYIYSIYQNLYVILDINDNVTKYWR